jgi:hypothetical protein
MATATMGSRNWYSKKAMMWILGALFVAGLATALLLIRDRQTPRQQGVTPAEPNLSEVKTRSTNTTFSQKVLRNTDSQPTDVPATVNKPMPQNPQAPEPRSGDGELPQPNK